MGGGTPREYDVVVERDSEGFYVATVPALPGCHTQARSRDELMERIREAIELCVACSVLRFVTALLERTPTLELVFELQEVQILSPQMEKPAGFTRAGFMVAGGCNGHYKPLYFGAA